MVICFDTGCSGSIGVLSTTKGIFAIEPDQYKATMRCRWKIVVESSKVSNLCRGHSCVLIDIYIYIYINIYIYTYQAWDN